MHFFSRLSRTEVGQVLLDFRREFWLAGFFSLVINALLLTPTLYMLQLYDRVLVSNSEITLLTVSFVTVFLLGWMGVAEWGRNRLLIEAGLRLDSLLSARLFAASFGASLRQLSTPSCRAFSDLTQLRQFLTGSGILTFFDAPWTLIYLAVLFFLHPWLGAMGLVFIATQAILAGHWQRQTLAPLQTAATAQAELDQFVQGKLRNAEVLEVMGMLPRLQQLWAARQADCRRKQADAQSQTHRATAWSKLLRLSQQSLALGAGALLVIDGQLSPGAMIAGNVLMSRAMAPIDQMVGLWRVVDGARAAFMRLEDLLQSNAVMPAGLDAPVPGGDLLLRHVTASAGEPLSPILKDISLTIPAGSVVVVLGASGSGKSTLARVLVGAWPHLTGEVWWGDGRLDTTSAMARRTDIGYLPQDVELFDGTIAENIARFGTLEPDRIIAAASCTGLQQVILRLPKAYDTPLGEAGSLLSAGQRQRLALARAVYANPRLLVLDEPNAHLDDAGELALYQAVQACRQQGATVVLVSHRPGALAVADVVLLLRDGRVVHQGPREAVQKQLQLEESREARHAP